MGAGASESMVQLKLDMEWWFSASNHEVKIVVLAKLDRCRDRIILQGWEEEMSSAARLGATTTRASTARSLANLEPKLQQEIEITRDTTIDPSTHHVVSSALVLKF